MTSKPSSITSRNILQFPPSASLAMEMHAPRPSVSAAIFLRASILSLLYRSRRRLSSLKLPSSVVGKNVCDPTSIFPRCSGKRSRSLSAGGPEFDLVNAGSEDGRYVVHAAHIAWKRTELAPDHGIGREATTQRPRATIVDASPGQAQKTEWMAGFACGTGSVMGAKGEIGRK